MVVGANIEIRVRIARRDLQRRRLLAPFVATGFLPRFQRGQQALGHWSGRCFKSSQSFLDHLWAGQHVAGNRDIYAAHGTAPAHAVAPGMGGDAAGGIENMQLPVLPPGILG